MDYKAFMGEKKVIQNLFRQGPWQAETESIKCRISRKFERVY